MAFNSIILVRNQETDHIERFPDQFWQKAWVALNSPEKPLEFPAGGEIVGQAVWNENEEATGLLAVGGGEATVLLNTRTIDHQSRAGQEALFKLWANELGYNVSKK
jgi:hypothetical protein